MLEFIIVIALFITGINIASQEGYILHSVKNWVERMLTFDGKTMSFFKPIWGCPTCMASFWSIVFYTMYTGISLRTVPHLILIIPAVATLTTLLDR